MRARLFDEHGRTIEHDQLVVDDGVFVVITGHPGLGPIRAFVFDGCFFGETDEQCYARYREGEIAFTQLKADEHIRCPRCGSPNPLHHPAMQFEGEVQVCPHPFHPTAVKP